MEKKHGKFVHGSCVDCGVHYEDRPGELCFGSTAEPECVCAGPEGEITLHGWDCPKTPRALRPEPTKWVPKVGDVCLTQQDRKVTVIALYGDKVWCDEGAISGAWTFGVSALRPLPAHETDEGAFTARNLEDGRTLLELGDPDAFWCIAKEEARRLRDALNTLDLGGSEL